MTGAQLNPPTLLLCVDCRTAVVADTFAKRKRIPKRRVCPRCGAQEDGESWGDGETWRPVEGTPRALDALGIEYEAVEAESLSGWP